MYNRYYINPLCLLKLTGPITLAKSTITLSDPLCAQKVIYKMEDDNEGVPLLRHSNQVFTTSWATYYSDIRLDEKRKGHRDMLC